MGRGSPTGRMHWMDVLRGVSVLLVVLFHAIIIARDSTPHPLLWFNDAAGPYRIPALMLASGILLPCSLQKPAGVFALGKLRTLAWPWLVWTAVMVPLTGEGAPASPMWWVNGTHTWFLSVLLVLYLCALVTRWVPLWVLPVVLLVAHQVLVLVPGGDIHRFFHDLTWFGVFFYCGALLRERLLERSFPVWAMPVGLLLSALWAIHSIKNAGADRDTLLSAAASLIGIVTICLVAQNLPRLRALEWVGRNSIVVYVVHWPVLLLLITLGDVRPGLAGVAERFLLAVVVSLLAAWARPWTEWLYEFPSRRRASRSATEAVEGAALRDPEAGA